MNIGKIFFITFYDVGYETIILTKILTDGGGGKGHI